MLPRDVTAVVEIIIIKRDEIMGIPEGIVVAGKKLITILGPIAADELKRRVEEYRKKPHGSKVKEGIFKDCTIELDGDRAFIAVNPEKGEIVWLTSDNIQSYQFMQEKKKFHNWQLKTYYYYHIIFNDGNQCYARMREKYRDAMINNA